jgi:hypothetical protein
MSYNEHRMARGWESKSVESQQAEAAERPQKKRPPLTPEQAAREREKQGLMLARQRILAQIAAAQHPRHLQMLQAALADLDARIAEKSA